MKLGAALYHLQTIELTIIEKRKRLQVILKEMEHADAIQLAKVQLDEAQAQIEPLETQLHELEWQLQSNQTKRESSEKRLYDGSVTKPKELQDIQKEVSSLTKRSSELEKQLADVKKALIIAQDALQKAQSLYDNAEQVQADEQALLVEEQATLEQEIETLLSERRDYLPNIDEESLAIYNQLRKGKGNRPVSIMVDDSCNVCGVEQTIVAARAVRQTEGLSYCTNCKRILVYL